MTKPSEWSEMADALLKLQGVDTTALKAENAVLRLEVARLRSELAEATARASRLAKLHARSGA